jgi:acyl-CoA thioester hydrolase
MIEHEIQIRVRYCETDAMGYLHHSHYLSYFESGRTELLRAAGGNYRGMEARGLFMVIVKAEVRYHQPARYDDLLTLRTRVARITPAKLEHEYRLMRDETLLAEGRTTLACVDRQGVVQRMTDVLPGETVEA